MSQATCMTKSDNVRLGSFMKKEISGQDLTTNKGTENQIIWDDDRAVCQKKKKVLTLWYRNTVSKLKKIVLQI